MSDDHDSVINITEALLFTDGDREMLASMAEMLLTEGKQQLAAIKTHLDAENLDEARKAAHALKGSVTIFAAREATAATIEMERVASPQHKDLIPQAWTALVHEFDRLCTDAQRLIAQTQHGSAADQGAPQGTERLS